MNGSIMQINMLGKSKTLHLNSINHRILTATRPLCPAKRNDFVANVDKLTYKNDLPPPMTTAS